MTTLYSTYGTDGEVRYLENAMVDYPQNDQVVVLPSVYVPRIYGKDLSAFEIASSGKIAVTLSDLHTFDLEYKPTSSNINFLAQKNYGLAFATSNANINLNHGRFQAYGSNGIDLITDQMFKLDAAALDWNIRNDLALASTGNVNISACNALRLTASSNCVFQLSNTNASLTSAGTISQHTGTDYIITAASNVHVTATSGAFNVSAGHGNMRFSLSNSSAELYALCNVSVAASNNYSIACAKALQVSAAGTQVNISMSSNGINVFSGGDVRTTTNSGYAVHAYGDVSAHTTAGSVNFVVGSNSSSLTMDSSNVALLSAGTAQMTTCNGDLKLMSGGSGLLAARDSLALTSGSIQMATNAFVFTASNPLTQTLVHMTGDGLTASADGDIRFSINQGITSIGLTSLDNKVAVTGASLNVRTANTTFIQSPMTQVVSELAVIKTPNSSNAVTVMESTGKVVLYSQSNTEIASEHQTYLVSSCNVSIKSGFNPGSSSLTDASATYLLLNQNKTVDLHADSVLSITSHDAVVGTAASNITFATNNGVAVLSLSQGAATLQAANNNSVTLTQGFATIASSCNTAVQAGASFLATAAQGDATVTSTMGSTALYAGSNLMFKLDQAASTIQTESGGSVTTSAGTNVIVSAANDITLLASNDFRVTAADDVAIHGFNTFMTSGNNAVFATAGTHTVQASNDLVLLSGQQQSSLTLSGPTISAASASNLRFTAAGNDIMTLTSTDVRINGNLVITGVVDSQTVTETVLHVQDKEILLAANYSNNASIQDGVANDKAGMRINGYPPGKPQQTADLYEKSFKWHNSVDGVISLGTAAADKEGFWDLLGGSFRLTHRKIQEDEFGQPLAVASTVSYGFRVNHLDELEIVKITQTGSDMPVYKRVAKFGARLLI